MGGVGSGVSRADPGEASGEKPRANVVRGVGLCVRATDRHAAFAWFGVEPQTFSLTDKSGDGIFGATSRRLRLGRLPRRYRRWRVHHLLDRGRKGAGAINVNTWGVTDTIDALVRSGARPGPAKLANPEAPLVHLNRLTRPTSMLEKEPASSMRGSTMASNSLGTRDRLAVDDTSYQIQSVGPASTAPARAALQPEGVAGEPASQRGRAAGDRRAGRCAGRVGPGGRARPGGGRTRRPGC